MWLDSIVTTPFEIRFSVNCVAGNYQTAEVIQGFISEAARRYGSAIVLQKALAANPVLGWATASIVLL